ncbi:MAG TPA: type I methionyl aminopeptidase [Dehalococcoidia bacterium]
MPIILKSEDEIRVMREAGQIVGEVLAMLVEMVRPGVTEKELDRAVRREYKRRGVTPTFLGYHGYPATVCVSVNDKIVHGIPSDRAFQEGDIVSIDLGVTYQGFVGDTAVTVPCGRVSDEAMRLIEVTRGALWEGIRTAQAGRHLSDISHAIQTYVESRGFSVVREYVGHGVGRQMHEEPQVPNYGPGGRGPILKPGMVLAIEPMVNVGDWRTRRHADNWTVSTLDGSLSAHFEHTIAIRDGEPLVLTLPEQGATPWQRGD